MKLVGELKKQVEETKNKEEAKEIIEKAGMELTDEELDNVTGGFFPYLDSHRTINIHENICNCDNPVKGDCDVGSNNIYYCKNCCGRIF
jgi:bacteriocin-like protein